MAGVSKEDVVRLMKSVVCVSVDLYPMSYAPDAVFADIVSSVMKERGVTGKDGSLTFDISFNGVLKCLDDRLSLSDYITEFKKSFNMDLGIGAEYDRLVSRYSSPEIVLFYGLFPDLSYFHISVHPDKDIRGSREKYVTSLYLPDLRIDTVSVKLRDYMKQSTVDELNRYIVDTTGFDDNVMSKKNMFMTNTIGEFFDLVEEFCKSIGDEDLYRNIYSAFSFLDIDEIKKSAMLVITDWPVL